MDFNLCYKVILLPVKIRNASFKLYIKGSKEKYK